MSLFDTIKQNISGLTRKRGKDVVLPNEAPETEDRKAEHRRRLAEDVSGRFQKVADNAMGEKIKELKRKGLSEADAVRKAHGGE